MPYRRHSKLLNDALCLCGCFYFSLLLLLCAAAMIVEQHCLKKRLKPGVSRSAHLFVAPFIWTAVGIVLMERGLGWMGLHLTLRLLLIALLIGTAKSLTVLDRTAKKGLRRIMGFGENTCIGAVYPWKTWLLVVLMMALGIALRKLTHPGAIIGAIYFAIGWALLLSSRHGWSQWLRHIRHK